ncbi:hypothetical protein ABZP36_009266 [Zizania latifolia]
MSMEDATCAFGGAMEMLNLPVRLEGLLRRHGSMLPKGADHEIPLVQRDLQEIISIHHDHCDCEPQLEGHAMTVRCWMTGVRELAYDMEDCIDLQRLWMANKIREFSLRTPEALQRHKMCNNLGGITTARGSSGSGHRPSPCSEFGHVGIDAAMNKIEEWLTDGEEKLKVISILGVGGVGKTTLANEIYRKLGRQFDCQAFVRSSQKPDMRRLLIGMLSQEPARMTGVLKKLEELDDGFSWSKYGPNPRGFYLCTNWQTHGCGATKRVQPTDGHPSLFDVVYYREHTCGDNANAHSDNQGSSRHAASSDKQEQSTTTYDRPDHTQHRNSALMMQPHSSPSSPSQGTKKLIKIEKKIKKTVSNQMAPRQPVSYAGYCRRLWCGGLRHPLACVAYTRPASGSRDGTARADRARWPRLRRQRPCRSRSRLRPRRANACASASERAGSARASPARAARIFGASARVLGASTCACVARRTHGATPQRSAP